MIAAQLRLHPRPFVIAVFGASVFALCTVASSIAVEWVIDNVIVPRFDEGEVAPSNVVIAVALIIGIGLLRAAGVVVRRTWAGRAQWQIAGTLSESVVDRLVRQPLAWHQRRPDGDLVARAGVDADAAVSVLAPIPFATGTVLLLVVSAIWLLATDLVLGTAAVAVFPVLIGLNIHYQRRVETYYDAAQGHLGDLSAGVHESFDGVQLVKAYGAEQRETERLATLAGYLRTARVGAVRLRGTFEALLDVLPSLANVGLVVLGAVRVQAGAITVGELTSFIYLFTLLVFPLRLIGYALSELPHSLAGWRRVRAVLDEPIEADPQAAITAAPRGLAVQLDAIRFTHPDEQRAAIDGVDLDVPTGRIVAVVGPTGAGKTTLLEIIAGLEPPGSGHVRLADGHRAIVFQEAFLFSGTIRHNLVLGRSIPEPELWEALRLSRADDFVAETADGLDTVVGERGVSLSGGQRQRIALARALVRRPSLLLLDDTTSALDPTTEGEVLANMRGALAGTTVLMVASRPSTIRLADEVVFFVAGRVADHGTHDELMARLPGYRALVEAFESDRAELPAGVAGGVLMTEPIGRFSGVHTINRGLQEAPVLRQGLGLTWLLAAVGATGRVVVPILLQQAIDRGIVTSEGVRVGLVVALAGVAAVALVIAGIAQRQAVVRLGQRSEQALYDLRTRLISHIHRISLADHNEERRGALVARVTSDIETLAQFFQWGGLAWLLDGPLMLMVAAVMLAYDWILAVVAFAVAAPLAIVLRLVQRHLVAAYERARERNGEMLATVTEVVTGAETIRAYHAGTALGAEANEAIDGRVRAQIRAHVIGAFLFPSGEVFSVLTVASVIVVGVIRGPESGLTAGAMIGFIFLTYRFLEPIAEFTEVLDQTQTAVAGLRRVARRARPARRPTRRRSTLARSPLGGSTSTCATSRSPIPPAGWPPPPTTPCCATSPRTSRPASRSPSSAPPVRGRRRSAG